MLSRKLQPEQLRDPAMDLLTQRDVQKAIPMLPTCRDARLCFALTLFRLCLCFACASLRILKSILLCIALICFALHCFTMLCFAFLYVSRSIRLSRASCASIPSLSRKTENINITFIITVISRQQARAQRFKLS